MSEHLIPLTDFGSALIPPSQKADLERLRAELVAATLPTPAECSMLPAGFPLPGDIERVRLVFTPDLTAPQEVLLAGVVANHSGLPLLSATIPSLTVVPATWYKVWSYPVPPDALVHVTGRLLLQGALGGAAAKGVLAIHSLQARADAGVIHVDSPTITYPGTRMIPAPVGSRRNVAMKVGGSAGKLEMWMVFYLAGSIGGQSRFAVEVQT